MVDREADKHATLWSSQRLSIRTLVERLGAALSSRYIIERELGRGGMAVVLLARDVKHGRKVAIKVLHPDLTDAVGSARFLREVRTTARLQHPHVLALYDSGEVDGLLYYIMPYVHGETLADRLRRDGALPVHLAVELALEIADALVYAHSLGVVHRDVKPANVLISDGAHACVADFGLARLLSAATNLELTATGIVVGSPLYMSPEQINGGTEVTGKADVYSLGCMLFEMLAGHPPFEGPTMQAVLTKHLMEDPPMLRTWRREVDPELDRLIVRAMNKEPEQRPDATQLRDRLSALRASASATASLPRAPGLLPETKATEPRTRPGGATWGARRLALTSLLLIGAALVVGTLGPWLYREIVPQTYAARDTAIAPEESSIAVLPFENLSGEPDSTYFSDGVTEDILTKLGKLGSFTVLSSAAVVGYRDSQQSPIEIGRELGVTTLLTGSIRRSGERIRIAVQLVDVTNGRLLWADSYDRELTDIFSTQSEIAGQIITALQDELTPEERVQLAQAPTLDLSAYSYYLKGREYLSGFREPRDVELGIGLFSKALEVDPGYAVAAAGKGLGFQMLYEYYRDTQSTTVTRDSAVAYGRRAIALDSTLADGYAVLGRAFSDERPVAAAAQLERAVELNPNHVIAVSEMSRVRIALGRYREALGWAKRAAAIEPTRAIRHADVAEVYVYLEDFDTAEKWLRQALQLEPDELWANYLMAWVQTARGNPEAAEPYIRTILDAGPSGSWGYVQAGWFALYRGDYSGALRHYERAADLTPGGMQPPLEVAYILRNLGRVGQADRILRAHEAAALSSVRRGAEGPKPYLVLARVNAVRGNDDVALDRLEDARDRGWRDAYRLTLDPLLRGLHDEGRFRGAIASMRADIAAMRQRVQNSGA